MNRPTSLVIFGASGDLTRRKLVPALLELHRAGSLPEEWAVFGFGRHEMGDDAFREPAFFAYTWPQPPGSEAAAGWSAELGEFVLPYEAVRTAGDPRRTLLDFLETAYRAGAGWA